MGYSVGFINKIVYILTLMWSALILGAGVLSIYDNFKYADSLAKNEAIAGNELLK